MDASAFAQFFTVLLIFFAVIVMSYLAARFIGGYQKTHNTGTGIEPIVSYRLNQTSYVQVLRIGSQYVAIAVAKDSVTKLCELSSEDVEEMQRAGSTGGGTSFAQLMERFKAGRT